MYLFNQNSLYVSSGNAFSAQNISGGILQLSRIQTVTYSTIWPHTEVNSLDLTSEYNDIASPYVDLIIEYLPVNGSMERMLGLVCDGENSALLNLNQGKNYFIQTETYKGDDAVQSNSQSQNVVAISQCVLNNYSVSASVGGLMRATANLAGINILDQTGSQNQPLPIVNYIDGSLITGTGFLYSLPKSTLQFTGVDENPADTDFIAVNAGQLLIEFPSGSTFASTLSGPLSCELQSFNLSISINRQANQEIGSVYPKSRLMTFPITVELTCSAFLEKYFADELQESFPCDSGIDANIIVLQPCSNLIAFEYNFNDLKLDSQEVTSAVNNFTNISFKFTQKIGNLYDLNNNFYFFAGGGTEAWVVGEAFAVTGQNSAGEFFFQSGQNYQRVIVENIYYSGQLDS